VLALCAECSIALFHVHNRTVSSEDPDLLLCCPDRLAHLYAGYGYRSSIYLMKQVQCWIPNLHLSREKQLMSLRCGAASATRASSHYRTRTNPEMRAVSHHGSNPAALEVCVISSAPMKMAISFARALLFHFRGHGLQSSASPATTPHIHFRLRRETRGAGGSLVMHGRRASMRKANSVPATITKFCSSD